MSARRTPDEWQRITGVLVMDPDGWDRRNFFEDWARPLTWQQFREKAWVSTCMGVFGTDWESRGEAAA